jgi:hypothetical protein
MSEEKPVFKVTDRRLFNADGSPRDGVERTEEAATPVVAETERRETSGAPASGATRDANVGEASRPSAASQFADDAPPARGGQASAQGRGTADDADPTAFTNLLMFIASPAAAAMGMTEHPGLPANEIDLPLAKHCIDLLGTLRQKTGGNLSMQEEQIIEGLLAELRMQYVALTTTRPSGGPRGFTGSDITGGR